MEREIIREIATAINSLGQLTNRILQLLAQNSENRNRRETRNNRPRRNQNTRRTQNNHRSDRNQNRNQRNETQGNFLRTIQRTGNMNIQVTRENTQAANITNERSQPHSTYTFSEPIVLQGSPISELLAMADDTD